MSGDLKIWLVENRAGLFVARYVDPVTNRTRQVSTGTRVKREAERQLGELRQKLETGTQADRLSTNFSYARSRFTDEHLVNLRESTHARYDSTLKLIDQLLSPTKVQQINDQAVQRVVDHLRRDGRQVATIACHLRHLKGFLNWCVQSGMLSRLPVFPKLASARRQRVAKGRPLTEAEVRTMIAAAGHVFSDQTIAAGWAEGVRVLSLSGIRLAEALLLTWNDDGLVRVIESGSEYLLRIDQSVDKTGVERLQPLTPDFADYLRRQERRTGFVLDLRVPRKPTDHRPTVAYASRKFTAMGKEAGITVDRLGKKFASAHDLRRTFGNRWAARVQPLTLKRLMRHASLETTDRYYVGNDAEELARRLREEFGASQD